MVNQAKTLAEKYPKSFIIWNILGASAAQIGMIDKSIESYKKAISIKPDYIEAYINMGLAYQHLGKLEEAIEEFKKALLVKPNYTEAYSNMGNAIIEQGANIAASLFSAMGLTAVIGNPLVGLAGPFAVESLQVIGPIAMAQARKNGRDKPNKQDWMFATGGALSSGALNLLPFTKATGGKTFG